MKEQAKTPVFQEDNGTWSHLTKLVNPLICTIEYGCRTGFSSREEAEESYQRSLASYQDQLSKLKKEDASKMCTKPLGGSCAVLP